MIACTRSPGFALLHRASALAALLSLSLLSPAPAHACSCMRRTLEEHIQSSTHIFEARVTRVVRSEEHKPRVHMQVVRSFKGDLGESVTVRTGHNGADCGLGFKEGKGYLVYANQEDAEGDGTPELWTSLCHRTSPIAEAGEDLRALGLGSTPFDPGPSSNQELPPSATTQQPGAHTKGGCASCSVLGDNAQRGRAAIPLLAALALVLVPAYRVTCRRRSGSRS